MSEEQECKEGSSTLTPVNETPRDIKGLADRAIPIDEFYVTEWSKTKKSRPSQVHIIMTLGKETQTTGVAVSIPLKSKRAASELIKALQRHRDAVWP